MFKSFQVPNYYRLKTEKEDSTIEFRIFELVYNPRHNILELYNISIQIQFTTSKRKLISSIANLVYELPNELSNDLRN